MKKLLAQLFPAIAKSGGSEQGQDQPNAADIQKVTQPQDSRSKPSPTELVENNAPPQSDLSPTSDPEVKAELWRWPSSRQVVVGTPGPVFEPKPHHRTHRVFPYRPDTVLDGWSTSHFTVRAASLRGVSHRHKGVPRQDDLAVTAVAEGQRLIIAVADGVSAAPQSHLGATAAVRYATQWLDSQDPCEAIDWETLVKSIAWSMVENASEIFEKENDPRVAEDLMATTLACGVLDSIDGEINLEAFVVGDASIWRFKDDATFELLLGGKATTDSEIHSSAVAALPRVPKELDIRNISLSENDTLFFATDGVTDPLGDGTGETGKLLSHVLQGVPPMVQFVHALDFSRQTFDDDRTMVAIWPKSVAHSLKG